MPSRRSRSRSRGRGDLRDSQTVAVDVVDGLVAREYLKTERRGPERGPKVSSFDDHRSHPPRPHRRPFSSFLSAALLPAGYPHSVTRDYLGFQVYDSLQGLCSYVRGVCSSAAVLAGLGVGSGSGLGSSSSSSTSSTATTPAAAATINAARDAVGMLAGFFLAATAAPGMDADAKRWRLCADVSNDVSLVLELVAAPLASAAAARWFRGAAREAPSSLALSFSFSLFPSSRKEDRNIAATAAEKRLRAVLFALLVSLAAAARALTGVAGGATRAALTAHFCRGSGRKKSENDENDTSNSNNAGDVAAKEGSQEAACTLVGMLLGLLLTRASTERPKLGAFAFALLTVLHVYFNARALRCLRLTSLNKARLELVVREMAAVSSEKGEERRKKKRASPSDDKEDELSVLTPADAAALEPLWPPPFLSFSRGSNRVVLGASLGEVAEAAGKSVEELLLSQRENDDASSSSSSTSSSSSSSSLPFVAAFSPSRRCSLVALRSDCSRSEEVAAYVLGLLLSGLGGSEELKDPGEAERWLRRRWFGAERRRRSSNPKTKTETTSKKPLAELLLERAGWDPIERHGLSKQGSLRYEVRRRRDKDE